MDFKLVDKNNIDREHICCALVEKPGQLGIQHKKEWLKKEMDQGLVFYKLDVRGKVFIEYLPGERALYPIRSKNSLHINCLWVAGGFQGQGYGKALLDYCIRDARAQDKDYISILASPGKQPFMADPLFLSYQGFRLADQREPYFSLYYYPLKNIYEKPSFTREPGGLDHKEDFTLYYTDQCPFAYDYARKIGAMAEARGYSFKMIRLENKEEVVASPVTFSSYSLYYKNKFLGHEILSPYKFRRLLDDLYLSRP